MAKWRVNLHLGKRYSRTILALSMLLMLTVFLLIVVGVGLIAGQRRRWTKAHDDRQSKEECEYLIDLATPRLKKSAVGDSKTGMTKYSSGRTSYGTFFRRGENKVIRAIEKRIADYTKIPVEHGEGLHVLRYELGQKYDPHYDYSTNGINTKNGGPRMATLLIYLSDVEEGGETVFPSAKGNGASKCANKGISVKPKMGDALLFWSMRPDGTRDPSSLHGASPVIKGIKWSCTKWMHVREFIKESKSRIL